MASTNTDRRESISFGTDTAALKTTHVAFRNAGKVLSFSNGEEAGDQKEKSNDQNSHYNQNKYFEAV